MTAPKPDFFVVGAPKSGTTSLFHYLKAHPDIHMPQEFEPFFFASDLNRSVHGKPLGVASLAMPNPDKRSVRNPFGICIRELLHRRSTRTRPEPRSSCCSETRWICSTLFTRNGRMI
jgi:hypothetical protein